MIESDGPQNMVHELRMVTNNVFEKHNFCEIKWISMIESDGPQNMVHELRMVSN
jgi:hypothetical protein